VVHPAKKSTGIVGTKMNASKREPFNWEHYVDGQIDCIIEDFLYLSDLEGLETMHQLGITHVVSLLSDSTIIQDPIENHLRLHVFDDEKQSLVHIFPVVFAYLDKCKENNHKVLVHCSAGISRSPAVVIAYLMHSKGMTIQEAYNHVWERRRVIYPNEGFMKQLNCL